MTDKSKVYEVDLDELKPDPSNANKGSERGQYMIDTSVAKTGLHRGVAVDANGYLVAGNKTHQAAIDAGFKRAIVVETDGNTLVVTKRLDFDLMDADPNNKARQAAYFDNRSQEVSLTWNPDQLLADMTAGLPLEDFWRQDELDELLAEIMPKPEVTDVAPQVDRAEELRQQWGTELGQMWRIGKHSLFCGDGTGVLPTQQTIIIDPEWNDSAWIDFSGFDNALVFFDNNHVGDVITHYGAPRWLFSWDCCTTWFVKNKPLLQAKFCAWYGNNSYTQDGWRYGESSFKKGKHTNGRGGVFDYDPHEDGRMLSDIFKRPIAVEHKDAINNHGKPLDWITALIANCTSGDVVDPFSGSGTSIIACEQLGRRCFAAEILPEMVALIIERCSQFGIQPITKISDAAQYISDCGIQAGDKVANPF